MSIRKRWKTKLPPETCIHLRFDVHFVYVTAVDPKSADRIDLFHTVLALPVLVLLVNDESLFIIEITVAVVTEEHIAVLLPRLLSSSLCLAPSYHELYV